MGISWQELGKKLTETADIVVEKTGKTVEVQKLKSKVRTQQRHISKDYETMGKMIFERYENGEVLDAEYTDICFKIQEAKDVIKSLEEEIEEVQEKDI